MDVNDAHGPGSNSLAKATETTPGTPPPPGPTPTPGVTTTVDAKTQVEYTTLTIISAVLGIIFAIVFSYGAAKLSFDKYRSIGWAILDFFFSSFYYPYYAIFLNSPTTIGGRR
jgi:hypothetical protein